MESRLQAVPPLFLILVLVLVPDRQSSSFSASASGFTTLDFRLQTSDFRLRPSPFSLDNSAARHFPEPNESGSTT